jgi:hypothetical protein
LTAQRPHALQSAIRLTANAMERKRAN